MHLVWQDPVPPEVISLLRKSDNPLLHQIFSEKDTKNQSTKELSKVTVVSKFKVGAMTCGANRFAQLWHAVWENITAPGVLSAVKHVGVRYKVVRVYKGLIWKGCHDSLWGSDCRTLWRAWWRSSTILLLTTLAASNPTQTANQWLSKRTR